MGMTSRRMLIKNKPCFGARGLFVSAKTRRALIGGLIFFSFPVDLAIAGSVEAAASATISSGVSIISNQAAGSAVVIGGETASFQVLGTPDNATGCIEADICLSKVAANSVPMHISVEFE